MDQYALKMAAARESLRHVATGMTLGVGTGSTVTCFLQALGESGLQLAAAVSSSEATSRALRRLGVPLADLNELETVELYIDGADEVSPGKQLIKGGGGAMTREKIIAACSRRFICIADESKFISTLGRGAVPVEVIPLARGYVARQLAALGGRPVWRVDFTTDNGNQILDVHDLRLDEAAALERRINNIVGVVSVGLFAERGADLVILAEQAGVRCW